MIIPYLTQANSTFFTLNNTGLGNALFQIFTAYGLAKKYNHTFNNYYLIQLLIKLKNFNLNQSLLLLVSITWSNLVTTFNKQSV